MSSLFHSILDPFDFSEYAQRALDRALALTEPENIHLVHVLPHLDSAPAVLLGAVTNQTRSEKIIGSIHDELAGRDLDDVKVHEYQAEVDRELKQQQRQARALFGRRLAQGMLRGDDGSAPRRDDLYL